MSAFERNRQPYRYTAQEDIQLADRQRPAMESSRIKSIGYLISCLSVVSLGIVSWKSASEQPALMLCLIFGMLTSVIGMGMRWLSYQLEHKRRSDKAKAPREPHIVNSASDATS